MRRWRLARGWSTLRLAQALGYQRRQVERLETQENQLKRRLSLAIAAIDCGIDPMEDIVDEGAKRDKGLS